MKRVLFSVVPLIIMALSMVACEPEEVSKGPEPQNALEGCQWVHEIKNVVDGVTLTTTTVLVFTEGKYMKKTVTEKESWLLLSDEWTEEDDNFTYKYDGDTGSIYYKGNFYCDMAYDGNPASPLKIIKQKPSFPAYDTILYERKKL